MKKIISFIMMMLVITACLIVASGCGTTSKADDDSFNIDPDYLDLAQSSPNDEVIKVLCGNRLYKFALDAEIKEVWENSDKDAFAVDYYIVASEQNQLSIKSFLKDSEDRIDIYDGFEFFCDDIFIYAFYPERVFNNKTEVINTYCFVEAAPNGWNGYAYYIYFVTNKGDFVLYKVGHDGEVYLLPLRKFVKMVDALAEEHKLHERLEEEGEEILFGATSFFERLIPFDNLFDMTSYKFTEKS